MQHVSHRTLLAYALVPGIAYPLYACVFFLSDSLFGERLFLYQLHTARHQLWTSFWSDYAHALPVFYGLGLLLFVLPTLLVRRYDLHWVWLSALLGLLCGGVIGAYLAQAVFTWITLLHALVGALLGGAFALLNYEQRPA